VPQDLARALGTALVAWLACGAPWPAAAGAVGPGGVRALQARRRRLLESGAERSPTFRRLLEEIAASDVVVYVDLDPYDGRKLDGVLQFKGAGNGVRYVAVWLQPWRIDDELIVTLAHELEHAVEVARARHVGSQASLVQLYEAIGRSDNPGRFETRAAQDVAAQVAAELRSGK